MTRPDARAAASLVRRRICASQAFVFFQCISKNTSSDTHQLQPPLLLPRLIQLRRQKAITCWDDDDEEHGNEIEAGGQLRLLLPHDLLSSSCRSDLDLFFVVRSFLCSSSLDRWFFFRSVLLLFFRFVLHRRFFFGFGVLRVLKFSLRDLVLLFKTGVLETQDLCGIFCPLCLAQRLAKRVFETRVLIWISSF